MSCGTDSPRIDVALVTQLVAQQFPQWAHLSIAPVSNSGWDNRTFHLGTQMSVRLPSAPQYARAVEIEQKWLPVLAPQLPLAIPKPLAQGRPGEGYPWPWSVYQWVEGDVATWEGVADLPSFAETLATFLAALQRLDTAGGPTRTMRGGSLDMWAAQAEAARLQLARDGRIDGDAAAEIWSAAMDAPFEAAPVWFHGDIARGNLLVKDGRLRAVIDFGGLGVGDPGCDMVIAWTFLDAASRSLFRERVGVSDTVWRRGRGWALWKAMIVEAGLIETNAIEAASSRYALDQLLGDHPGGS